jgi:GAF domain-containing protein
LTKIGLKGEGGRSLQVCLNSILDAALDAFGIRKTGIGTIHLYDRETHTLRLVAFRGHIDRLDDAWVQSVRETDRPGVITIVALKGKSILIEDLTKSPYGAIHRCIRDGTRSELAVPMLADGVVVGVISLESTQPGAFTSDSLRVLWNAANEAALAVLLDREKTAHREKEQLLNRFLQFHNRAATSHLGAPLPLAELAAIACETLDASMCDLWQYNPKTEEFDTAGFSHPNRSRTPGPRKNGWSAYLQRTGWPIWITRVKQDDQFDVLYWDPQAQAWQSSPPTDDSPQTVSPHLRELGVQCELGIPILVHQQCIGVAWLKYQDDMVQEPSITNLEQAAGFVGAAALVLYRNGKGPLFIPSQTRMSLVEEFTGKVAQLMQAHFEG